RCRQSGLMLGVLAARFIGLFFFFQAEDGIRDATVTGVQTCALPISAFRPTKTPSTINPMRESVFALVKMFWISLPSRTPCVFSRIGRASCRERVEVPEVDGALKRQNR